MRVERYGYHRVRPLVAPMHPNGTLLDMFRNRSLSPDTLRQSARIYRQAWPYYGRIGKCGVPSGVTIR